MPHINTTKDLKNERGQTMAELALVLPVLLVLLLGIAQFGVVFNNYVSLTDAVRAGARKGAVSRNLADPAGACRAQVLASAGSLNTTELGRNLSCTYSSLQPGADVTVHRRLPLRHQIAQLESEERPFHLHDEGASGMSRTNERGQAVVLMVISLAVLTGMAALVLDVGIWMRTDRRLQATADAAALAGAQKLPTDVAGAKALAQTYANQNGGDVLGSDIIVTSTYTSNDTISVRAAKTQSGIFSKILGINSANIKADAKARVDSPQQARYVAPMVVYCGHSLIQNCDGSHTPTFGVQTTMDYDKMGAPGAFGMLNLDERKRDAGLLGGRRLDPPRVRQVPAARHVPLRPGREVQLPERQRRPRCARRHRASVPGLQDPERNRPERAVRDHRLDRVLPDEGNNARQQRNTRRAISPNTSPRESSPQSGSGAPNTFGVRSVQLVG